MKIIIAKVLKLTTLFILLVLVQVKANSAEVICDISMDTPMPVCPGIYFELSVFEEPNLTFEWQEKQGDNFVKVGDESILGTSIEDSTTFRVIVVDTITMETCTSNLFGVSVRPIINIEFDQLQLTCTNGDNDNGNSAKVRATASGAFNPDEYHYLWDVHPLQIAPGDSTLALNLKAHQYYSITVVDNYGCPKTEQFWTEAFSNPEVEINADPDTAYLQNPFVTYSYINLSEDSIPITNHFWWFSDTIPDPDYQNTSDLLEPTYEYGSIGQFYTILTVFNPEGCDTTYTKFVDVKPIKLFIPIIHLSVNLASILAPSLGTATLSLLLFKSLDYSIFRASKEILYMPLSYDARYRAKQLIDSLIYRNGEGLTAGVNALIDVVFVIPIVVYPVTAIMMSFLWIGIVLNLTRQYQNLVSSS